MPDLPTYTKDIVLEFEQLYENTHYQILQPCDRRRSLTGAVDRHGNPVYDRLLRGIDQTVSQGNNRRGNEEVQKIAASKRDRKQRHSIDLGELQRLTEDLGDVLHRGMTETSTSKQGCQRPFSIDLGHCNRVYCSHLINQDSNQVPMKTQLFALN